MQSVDDQTSGNLDEKILGIRLSDPTATTPRIAQVIMRVVIHPVALINLSPRQTVATVPRFLLPTRRRCIPLVRTASMRWRTIAPRVLRRVGQSWCSDQHHDSR